MIFKIILLALLVIISYHQGYCKGKNIGNIEILRAIQITIGEKKFEELSNQMQILASKLQKIRDDIK